MSYRAPVIIAPISDAMIRKLGAGKTAVVVSVSVKGLPYNLAAFVVRCDKGNSNLKVLLKSTTMKKIPSIDSDHLIKK